MHVVELAVHRVENGLEQTEDNVILAHETTSISMATVAPLNEWHHVLVCLPSVSTKLPSIPTKLLSILTKPR